MIVIWSTQCTMLDSVLHADCELLVPREVSQVDIAAAHDHSNVL